MRAILVPLAATIAAALPALADTSPPRTDVDYRRFAEVAAAPVARVWYITPDGKFVANQAGADVVLTDAATGKEHGRLSGHGAGIHDAGFSSNGKLMATSGNDATVKVWDLATCKELKSFNPFGAYS